MPAPLSEVSDTLSARTRTTVSMLRKRAQDTTNAVIAHELGIDASNVSRWRDEHLDRAVQFILACGCKVVPADLICITERRKTSLEYYADIGWRTERDAPPMRALDWEDE